MTSIKQQTDKGKVKMTLDEAIRIDALIDIYDDLPDGAFFAVLEENGIYPEDIDEAQEILEEQSNV